MGKHYNGQKNIRFAFFILFSCSDRKEQVEFVKVISIPDCTPNLTNKDIFDIADSIIRSRKNAAIWNISNIDTVITFRTEDYFTHKNIKAQLVVVAAEAGLSAGNEDKLMMLFTCEEKPKIIWSGQTAGLENGNMSDLDNDGIKEIGITANRIWMGECSKTFSVFNFKGGRRHDIFSTESSSVIDCGLDNLTDRYKLGDTLEIDYDYDVLPNNTLKQVRRVKLHNGGKTDEEIVKYAKTTIDYRTLDFTHLP